MLSLLIWLSAAICVAYSGDASTCSTFSCEYNVLLKLIKIEETSAKQDTRIAELTEKLEDAENTISKLDNTIKSSGGTTYIRWGRKVCPNTADLVYDGYVGGSHYAHSGSGSNILCLPKDPSYSDYQSGYQEGGKLYGAEYQTIARSKWKNLHDHDIPCAVCRIPRTDVIMIPGKNSCHKNYILEYKGYLMSENYKHSSSEFVCVDEQPETITGSHSDKNGLLFYFVEGICGSLPCGPYKDGYEMTCAVCSYSNNAGLTNLQP